MYSRINEKRIYVIDITFSINESIFSGNEQQKVYFSDRFKQNLHVTCLALFNSAEERMTRDLADTI